MTDDPDDDQSNEILTIQRKRIVNKTDRPLRAVRLNPVALSAVVALTRLDDLANVSPLSGSGLVAFSVAIVPVGISMSNATFDWTDESLTERYARRLHRLSPLVPAAYVTGLAGTPVVAVGVVQSIEFDPPVPLRLGLLAVGVLGASAVVTGRVTAKN